MYELQHRITTSKNMVIYKQVVRPHRRLQLATVYKKVYSPPLQSQPSSFHWMKLMTKLHCSMYLTCGTYQKGWVSLRAQGTKRQVIYYCAYACPQKNHVMLWNNVTGSLTSLSMICLLLWLCSSGMLKKMTGSFNYLSCSVISDNKYKIRKEIIQQ